MKTLRGLQLLITLLFISSCSTNESVEELSSEDSFKYNYDGETINLQNWNVVKSENSLAVSAMSEDGHVFAIGFNVFGNLMIASSYSTTFDFPSSDSFEYFKSNYFNFELVAIDEVNKRVSGKFSGDLYEDHYDINSTKHYVEGSFVLPYVEVEPQISGLEVSAKIDGKDWYSTDGDESGGFSGTPSTVHHFNDGPYSILYTVSAANVSPGSYQFDSNSSVNNMSFARYDPSTNEFIEYETSGVFNVDEYIPFIGFSQIKGSFSFTATHDGEVIEVTNGKINDVFIP